MTKLGNLIFTNYRFVDLRVSETYGRISMRKALRGVGLIVLVSRPLNVLILELLF